MSTLTVNDFDFTLPDELIARYPEMVRSKSRLLVLNRDKKTHHDHVFTDVLQFLTADDLLVVNNSKVMAARLFAEKSTSGQVEILVERIHTPHLFSAMVRSSKPLKTNQVLTILHHDKSATPFTITVLAKEDSGFWRFQCEATIFSLMDQYGAIPLPPYMERSSEDTDIERYQTVYAKPLGSCAAPTAGLHFDATLLNALKEKGIAMTELTLHVGAGTFMPIRTSDLSAHKMHQEWVDVTPETVQKIRATKAKGGRVIAVGTTSTRALETAALSGELKPYQGETDLFIKPGFQFKVVDGLITNFHLPQSTLLILVSAFAGREFILGSYQYAVKSGYRFYSYGDAMLIL